MPIRMWPALISSPWYSIPANAVIILYRTTATPSFRRDSPNTKKYKWGFTPTSVKIDKTATCKSLSQLREAFKRKKYRGSFYGIQCLYIIFIILCSLLSRLKYAIPIFWCFKYFSKEISHWKLKEISHWKFSLPFRQLDFKIFRCSSITSISPWLSVRE